MNSQVDDRVILPVGNVRVAYLANQNVVDHLVSELVAAGSKKESLSDCELITFSGALLRKIFSFDVELQVTQHWHESQIWFYVDSRKLCERLPSLDADLIVLDERTFVLAEPKLSEFRKWRKGSEGVSVQKEKLARKALRTGNGELEKSGLQAAAGQAAIAGIEAGAGARASVPSGVLVNVAQASLSQGDKVFAGNVNYQMLCKALEQFSPKAFHFPSRRRLVVLPNAEGTAERTFKLGLANVRRVIVAPQSSFELLDFSTRQLVEFRTANTKTALCVSGGGLEGYIYSLGVTNALEECFVDKTNNDFDIYCGVSSGSLLAMSLSAGISTSDLIKQLYRKKGRLEPLSLSTVFDFAGGEIGKRLFEFLRGIGTLNTSEILLRLQKIVPVGFFKGDKLKSFVEGQLKRMGLADNLALFSKEIYISATDQDTGEPIVFGEDPWKDVKASQAVRASSALPPFYLPERVRGHWFADGQLTSSSDFNIAIRKGARFVVLVDPMVPYTSLEPGAVMKHGGYFTAVQAIKSLVHTRSESFLKHAMDVNPDVDFLVLRPTDEVMAAMAGNPM